MSASLGLRSWVARSGSAILRRKQSQELLNRLSNPSDDFLRLLFDDSAVGIAVVDESGRLVRVNHALRRLLSQDCNLSPGRPLLGIFCDKYGPGLWAELDPVLRGRNLLRGYVCFVRGRRDIGTQAVEIAATPVCEADGSVKGAVVHFLDISTQKDLEAQLSQSQNLLAVGQLACGIAHDFNNLLTAVIGAADEALDRTPVDTETADDLQQIRASAGRGADLVRQLLAFGRQQVSQPRAVAVNQALSSVSSLLQRLLGSTVTLKLELGQPDPIVYIDPIQLDQVLINLAVNARDAMPNGGLLTLRTGHIDLFLPLVRDQETIPPGHYIVLEVQDTGVGIPQDVLRHIFEPFFTTRREHGGNGLGLSTVHRIVRQLDGFIAVDSAVGTGTRVRLHLPCVADDAAVIPVPPPALLVMKPQEDSQRQTILLVDDEDGVRRVAERAMTRRGWTVVSAADGEQALMLLTDPTIAAEIKAIVSDLAMPGLNGTALVEMVRVTRPGLPAILVSGYVEDTLRKRLVESDIQFMSKPYAMKDLISAVETMLSAHAKAPDSSHNPAHQHDDR